MNWFERSIQAVSPAWAFRRARYRTALAAYEAAESGRLRRKKGDNSSGDAVVGRAGDALRGYARDLEQNYDIAKGALDVLVNNIVGPNGITREPRPKRKDGTIHAELAAQLSALYKNWSVRPEVTWSLDYVAMERLVCRTWLRDGEVLAQLLEGRVPGLDHGTTIPFSLELIEADLLPMDLNDDGKGIVQGVERNAWGRATAFHLYRQHPGDSNNWRLDLTPKRVSADRILHIKIAQRIRQARGVSVFASVIRRLEDLKDYEESERVAARVAAALTGYIKKGTIDDYVGPGEGKKDRSFGLKPGMIFDGLEPGEEVGTIESKRPSGLLTPFHDSMVRFTSAGIGANYSSVSRNYNGTYSAQRQELVEGWVHYKSLSRWFVSQFSAPVHRRMIDVAVLSGALRLPPDVDMATLYDADFRGPAMPWIDPQKEATAGKILERAGHKSAQQLMRERGENPNDTYQEIREWRRRSNEDGVVFDTDPAHDKPAPAAPAAAPTTEEEDT